MAAFGCMTAMCYHFAGQALGPLLNIVMFSLNQASSSASLPFELQPAFFQIGYALPYNQVVIAGRCILYGSNVDGQFPRCIGVLFAWLGLMLIGSYRLFIRRRRIAHINASVKKAVYGDAAVGAHGSNPIRDGDGDSEEVARRAGAYHIDEDLASQGDPIPAPTWNSNPQVRVSTPVSGRVVPAHLPAFFPLAPCPLPCTASRWHAHAGEGASACVCRRHVARRGGGHGTGGHAATAAHANRLLNELVGCRGRKDEEKQKEI